MKIDKYTPLKNGRILAGEVNWINGKWVGAVAYTSNSPENLPSQIMSSYIPSPKRNSISPSLVERAAQRLRGEEEYAHLAQPQVNGSYD